MIDTLDIGKYIYSVLNGDTTLKSLVSKICPLVADNGTAFPFIVYRRTGLESQQTKDGYYEDLVSYEVIVVSDKYSVGLQIANRVRSLLEVQGVRYGDMSINDTVIIQATENYDNEAFTQTIEFRASVN